MNSRVETYHKNLNKILHQATIEEILAGQRWYPEAMEELKIISFTTGFELEQIAYATAALSANKRWIPNLALIDQVAHDVRNGKKISGHFPKVLKKAERILLENDLDALSGPKVVPFAKALMGDESSAVIDRWMLRAAGIEGFPTFRRSREVSEALRIIARETNQSVTDVQAIIWLTIQRLEKENGTES